MCVFDDNFQQCNEVTADRTSKVESGREKRTYILTPIEVRLEVARSMLQI